MYVSQTDDTCVGAVSSFAFLLGLQKDQIGAHIYSDKTGRRLSDRSREHHRYVEKDDQVASKPVAQHFIFYLRKEEKLRFCYKGRNMQFLVCKVSQF